MIGDGLNKRNCLTIDNRQVWILWCVGISVLYTELNAALGVRWTDMWNKVRNMVVKLVWYLPNVQRSCDTLKSILWKCRPVPTYTMSLGKDSSFFLRNLQFNAVILIIPCYRQEIIVHCGKIESMHDGLVSERIDLKICWICLRCISKINILLL